MKSLHHQKWKVCLLLTGIIFLFGITHSFAQSQNDYTVDKALEELRMLYEKAKESGSEASATTYNFLKEGLQKAETWEYQVITLKNAEAESLTVKMNELGKERWECFNVQHDKNKTTLIFKRQPKSYLSSLSLSQLLKLMAISRSIGSE